MDKRQERIEEGKKRGTEEYDDEDEWPDLPSGYRILTSEEQENQRREEAKFSQDLDMNETPTATDILNDMHMAANDNLLSSFSQDLIEETVDGGDIQESLLSVFDDNSNSPPPCPIVIDTIPDDDGLLFPGSS